MTRKQLFKEIKEDLKKVAKEIRKLKRSRKQDKRNGRALWEIEGDIWEAKWYFRHKHIAYCEIKGRTRDQIERPKDDNKASQPYIDKFKKEWEEKLNENVCVGAEGSN